MIDSHRFNRIESNKKKKLIAILEDIKKRQPLRIAQDKLSFIFEVWNKDVYPDRYKKMDATCAACRIQVIGTLTHWAGI
ncbi:MAG: hypothetical protein QGI60_02975 [archaeon]|nr:hypothetical protein [archaeon]